MKKFFHFTLLSAIMLTGCHKPATENSPQITLDNQTFLDIPGEGGTVSLTYNITDPVEGGQISVEPTENWIHDIDCETSGIITFLADANETEESRSQIITITYTYGEGQSTKAQINAVQNISMVYNIPLDVLTGAYYGNALGIEEEHNYYTWLSDKEFSSDGYSQNGGTYYLLDIYAPAPEDPSNPLPIAGSYTLGAKGATSTMTFSPDYSKGFSTDENGNTVFDVTFTEGTMTIDYEGDAIIINATLLDNTGKTHYVRYHGPAGYEDKTQGIQDPVIDRDIEFHPKQSFAGYMTSDGNTMEAIIRFSDMELDEYGYLVPPGTFLSIDAFMPHNEAGEIATGTYTVSDSKEAFTIYPGYLDGVYYLGTIATDANAMEEYFYGLICEGQMTVSGGNGNYTIVCDFKTKEGHSISCTFNGEMTVGGVPTPYSTLTDDYTLDLEGATASATFYGDLFDTEGGSTWIMTVFPTDGPDGVTLTIVSPGMEFDKGIASGTYIASLDGFPDPGEYAQGTMYEGTLSGTNYTGGYVDYRPTLYAPAISGELNITNNGDGTYEISFSFLDDRGHTWDGSWSGEVGLSNLSGTAAAPHVPNVKKSPFSLKL